MADRTCGLASRVGLAGGALVIALLMGLVPSTAGAFVAKVKNSTDTATAASRFACDDTFAASLEHAAAYLEYRLSSTTSTEIDQGHSSSQGTYQGAHPAVAATGTDACARSNTVAPNVYSLDGSTSAVTTANSITAPTTFSVALWFRTTATGVPLMGLGSSSTGSNSYWDRAVALDSSGHVTFSTNTSSSPNVITSSSTFNDGAWHQVVATQSSGSGMVLYVDGASVASSSSKGTQTNTNYWRIGSNGTSYFSGTMRYAAAYNISLSSAQVAAEYRNGT